MIAISTAYWPTVEDGEEILNEVDRLGFESIELSSYTGKNQIDTMLPTLRRKKPQVVSLHNPCPKYQPHFFPYENNQTEPLLTAIDANERLAALSVVEKTMELAADLEVPALVLHLGETNLSPQEEWLQILYDQERIESDEGRERISLMLEERTRAGEAIWDPLQFSLEAVTRKAEKLNLFIGLENRIYIHEVPTYLEIEKILISFAGGNFMYWHDTGHATVHHNFGLVNSESILESLGENILGIHIHDAAGYDDHIAPGQGDTNFSSLVPYLNPETILVIETHPQAAEQEVLDGIEILIDAGIKEI